jgi:hypothetical protein
MQTGQVLLGRREPVAPRALADQLPLPDTKLATRSIASSPPASPRSARMGGSLSQTTA